MQEVEPGTKTHTPVSVIEIVTDDMPFLVDSVMAELTDRNIDIRLVVHPIVTVQRDGKAISRISAAMAPRAMALCAKASCKSMWRRWATRPAAPKSCRRSSRCSVRFALRCRTGGRCSDRVAGIVADLKANPPPIFVEEIAEAVQFLQWLVAGNFTFIGICDYVFSGKDTDFEPVPDSALGILRAKDLRVLRRNDQPVTITPQIRAFLEQPRSLIVTKANVRSSVHRRMYLDYIGVKRFDADGHLIGETRIVGLFTSTAYTRSARTIPYLRRKVDRDPAHARASTPADTPARRWSMCWKAIRATSCSRSTRTRC